MPRYRNLNEVEETLTYSNAAFPLSTVIVIQFKGQLTEKTIINVLNKLQERHTLLRAKISKTKSGYRFAPTGKSIPLAVHLRGNENSWVNYAEEALNTTFDTDGPLLNGVFIKPEKKGAHCELFLVLHHSIIDGIAARLILEETLKLLGGETLQELPAASSNSKIDYPPPYNGFGRFRKIAGFIFRQFIDELKFHVKGARAEVPAGSHNFIKSFQIDPSTSRKIMVSTGRKGLSLNSIISAALLHAYYHHGQQNKEKPLYRTMAFADLRSKLKPAVSPYSLGCYFSMIRFSIGIKDNSTLEETARKLWEQMYQSGKSGDLFLYAMMSKHVMRMALKLRKFRMANTALSFIGKLDLKKHYGPLEVLDVKTFITNNQYGPNITAFGRTLFGRIELDLNFLAAEFSEEAAEEIALGIKKYLEAF